MREPRNTTRTGFSASTTALAARYRRIAARHGAKRAIMAVAYRLVIIAYHVIAQREPYRGLGADDLDRQQPAALADRLLRRLRQLGVELQVLPTTRPPESADNALAGAT